jgi:pilus assembly protein Flp/PilA
VITHAMQPPVGRRVVLPARADGGPNKLAISPNQCAGTHDATPVIADNRRHTMLVPYLTNYLASLRKKEDGVTMIEYGLLAALIAVALIATIILVRNALQGTFNDVATGLS